ncbi:hypothetical protein JR346_08855 [Rothia sp. ZJ932]|nr:VIT1/CCC1 transporter family protein [Rothia sp. ZJ932]QRZ61329.1 hypothetical protein JR346_08855 [Rothia sp. ZJ932]
MLFQTAFLERVEALITKEKQELAQDPEEELNELTAILMDRGFTAKTARTVALELTEKGRLARPPRLQTRYRRGRHSLP